MYVTLLAESFERLKQVKYIKYSVPHLAYSSIQRDRLRNFLSIDEYIAR